MSHCHWVRVTKLWRTGHSLNGRHVLIGVGWSDPKGSQAGGNHWPVRVVTMTLLSHDSGNHSSELLRGNASTASVPNEVVNSSTRDIIIYVILFIISSAGNISVFTSLLRNRNRKLRINLLILNLAIADLIVTFIMIPLEVGWRITGSWRAGDFACRLMQALRAFGPYLSSMVLVCISFDRYFAIIHPLKVNDSHRRSKIMLYFSWIISIVCSIPQVCDPVTDHLCAISVPSLFTSHSWQYLSGRASFITSSHIPNTQHSSSAWPSTSSGPPGRWHFTTHSA